jgi:cell division protein ZipA
MELSIKDWMIIIGVLLLAAVLFDGLRRVINERRSNIRMRAKPVYDDARVDSDLTNHEIASNARVVLRADGSPMPLSEQQVPVLLEPADDLKAKKSRRKKKEKAEHVEPVFHEDLHGTIDAFADEMPTPAAPQSVAAKTTPSASRAASPYSREVVESYDENTDDYDDREAADAINEVIGQQAAVSSKASSTNDTYNESRSNSSAEKNTSASSANDQDVVVLHVLAKDNSGFKGADLMQILLGCDMRYGRMNIFHRFEEGSTEDIQFSVANLVEPGTFDLDALHHFSSPGISFFMTLPGPQHPLQSFDYMVMTAQEVAKHLDGEILDDRKRVVDSALIVERRHSIERYAAQTASAY